MTPMEQIKARLKADLAPARPLASEKSYTAWFVLAAWCPAALLMLAGSRSGWNSKAGWGLAALAVLLAAAWPAGRELARLMTPGSGASRGGVFCLAWLVTLAVIVAVTADAAAYPGFGDPEWECFRFGVVVALPVAAALVWGIARGHVLRRTESAAVLGLLAGGAGFAALEIGCPIRGLWHILQSHYGAGVAILAIGAAAGLLWDRMTRRRPIG